MIFKLIMLGYGVITGLVGLFFTWLVEEAFAAEVIMASQIVFMAMIFFCVRSFRKNWKLFRSPDYEQYKIDRARMKQEKRNQREEKRRMRVMKAAEKRYQSHSNIGIGKVLLIVCGSIVYLILGPIILLTSGYMKKK